MSAWLWVTSVAAVVCVACLIALRRLRAARRRRAASPSFEAEVAKLRAEFEALGVAIGTALLPPLQHAVEALNEITRGMR